MFDSLYYHFVIVSLYWNTVFRLYWKLPTMWPLVWHFYILSFFWVLSKNSYSGQELETWLTTLSHECVCPAIWGPEHHGISFVEFSGKWYMPLVKNVNVYVPFLRPTDIQAKHSMCQCDLAPVKTRKRSTFNLDMMLCFLWIFVDFYQVCFVGNYQWNHGINAMYSKYIMKDSVTSLYSVWSVILLWNYEIINDCSIKEAICPLIKFLKRNSPLDIWYLYTR